MHGVKIMLLSRSFSNRRSSSVENDKDAFKRVSLEKLPTYDRLKKSVLSEVVATGSFKYHNVDVTTLSTEMWRKFIQRVLQVIQVDNERFLLIFRDRIERVGI
ncbi:hypothetical protein SUGI_0383390 [Cryptomeria japonica]|nr:hypothetical protein SUGI_0383390 [Cryptomeria japonica]